MTQTTHDCAACPVSAGTHKPADAVHTEIAEPAGETHLRELTAYRTTVDNQEAELSTLRARCAAQHEALMQAQAGLEFAVAFRRGQGCVVNEDPAKGFVLTEVLALQFVNSVLDDAALEAKAQGEPCAVDLPDVEDMAHGALQEALSFGLSHDVFHRHMRAVMDKTVEAMAAPSPAVPALQASVPAVTKEGKSYEKNFAAPQAALAAVPLPAVELFGVKDGKETSLGHVPMPPTMRARELLRDVGFTSLDDDDGEGAYAMGACEQLIEYCQAYYAAPAHPAEGVPAPVAAQASPTFMTADQGRDWAWSKLREDVGTEGWTVMDSVNYHGFFLHGWNYRGQYELQRAAAVAALKQELTAAPVAVGEREAFEAWARDYGTWEVQRDDDRDLGTTGYTDVSLTVAWHAVQASAALAATPAAPAATDEPPFLQRLRIEQHALSERQGKLEAFCESPEFSSLGETQRALLERQRNQQHALLQTMNQRIHSAAEQHLRSKRND